MIEIASPSPYRPEMAAKIRLWFDSGVRVAWVVWPETPQIDVWRPGVDLPATLGTQDELAGGDALPGFHCLVAQIFPGATSDSAR